MIKVRSNNTPRAYHNELPEPWNSLAWKLSVELQLPTMEALAKGLDIPGRTLYDYIHGMGRPRLARTEHKINRVFHAHGLETPWGGKC